jgi:uncharacterized Ntn-hydrolase superfamily protein
LLGLGALACVLASCTVSIHTNDPAIDKDDEHSALPVPVRPVATYSIVARDAATGRLGVAVQSHWFSVGSAVPWARAGVGAVATQSLVNLSFGPEGLRLMADGDTAAEALAFVLEKDDGRRHRQVAMIDASGSVGAHTGELCIAEASHKSLTLDDGTVLSAQANLMTNPGVPEAMIEGYQRPESGDSFEHRLLSALFAAQNAGGDIRGRQSAAMLVVDGRRHDEPWQGVVTSIRVEDHADPLDELARLVTIAQAYDEMNRGDLAIEHGDDRAALGHYGAALTLVRSPEIAFWTAVSLVNAGFEGRATPFFAYAFWDHAGDWRETLSRLPDSELFPDDPELLGRILEIRPDAHAELTLHTDAETAQP